VGRGVVDRIASTRSICLALIVHSDGGQLIDRDLPGHPTWRGGTAPGGAPDR